MDIKLFLILGALLGSIGVALGAIGAHLLKERLSPDQLAIMETGVRYQMYHAVAIIALALSMHYFNHPWIEFALWAMFAGTLLFSSSLYFYAWTSQRFWAMVTPIGGALLIISWIIYALGIEKSS